MKKQPTSLLVFAIVNVAGILGNHAYADTDNNSRAISSNTFSALAQRCAPNVSPLTIAAIVRTESSFNPFAIGVVGGSIKQPQNMMEAQAAVRFLLSQSKNFSMGLGQVNRYNLAKYGLTYETVFDPCKNLNAGGKILAECYARSIKKGHSVQDSVRNSFSCYYSGNFKTGYKHGYVQKVVKNAGVKAYQAQSRAVYVPAVGVDAVGTHVYQNSPVQQPTIQYQQPTQIIDYRQDPIVLNNNSNSNRSGVSGMLNVAPSTAPIVQTIPANAAGIADVKPAQPQPQLVF